MSVSSAALTPNGELELTMSDAQVINVGSVVGPEGPAGGGGGLDKANMYERTTSGQRPIARCDQVSDVLMFGGCRCPQTQLWESYPIDAVSTTNAPGWTCYAGNVNVTAYAVCLSVAP